MKEFMPSYGEIKGDIGTPSYVFNIDILQDRLRFLKETLGNEIGICYAMKANPFVVGSMEEYVDRYEVCSPGEFAICERADVPKDRIVLSGVYKEKTETERVIKTYGTDILYTAESEAQFLLINEAAIRENIKVDVLLRVTTGNQFGIDEELLCHIIEEREKYAGVNIVGIQHFSGTQRHNLKIYKEELDYCDRLLEKLRNDYSYEAEELEFGTGFYFEYFQPKKGKEVSNEEKLLKEFKSLLDDMKFKGKKILEIGRFIAASCGKYYTKVVDSKKNAGIHFCIVDGGMHQITYFGQMMAMKLPWFRQLKKDGSVYKGGEYKANICGSLCTINDNLVKNMPLTLPEVEDILEFKNAGAYSMTESPALFLSRDLPKVYLYSKKEGLKMMRDKIETNQFNYL